MQEAIKVMRREKIEGTIVNIGSMSAKAGQPFIAPIAPPRARSETLTKNTAYALLRNRIRVNGLNIGWMASEGEDRIQREYPRRARRLAGEGRGQPAVRPARRSAPRWRAPAPICRRPNPA